MIRRIILFGIWISFVAYVLRLAPLDHASTWEIGRKLVTLQWGDLNAYVLAIFWLMGVMPMVYAGLMFADGRMQPFRVWPYFIGANFTGVLCLLPYLVLRRRSSVFAGPKDKLLRILDRRSTGVALLVAAVGLVGYALLAGDWQDYGQQFQTLPFVHLISLDFCLICLIFPVTALFDDDLARRQIYSRRIFWAVALVPLFGPLLYLCLRPPLLENPAEANGSALTSEA